MLQQSAETLSPARRAWITRRAKMAASSAPITAPIAVAAPIALRGPTPIVPDAVPPKIRRMSEAEQTARAAAQAKTDQTELEPATEFRQVEINLDDAIVGCGNRRFVVLGLNAFRVRLFYAPLLVTTECPRDYFERHHRPATKQNRRVYAEIIRNNIARADRVNRELFDKGKTDFLPDGGADAQRVLALTGN